MANLTTDEEMDAYCIEQVKLGLVKFIELVHPEPVFVDGQVTNYKVISSIYTSTGTASYVAKDCLERRGKSFRSRIIG